MEKNVTSTRLKTFNFFSRQGSSVIASLWFAIGLFFTIIPSTSYADGSKDLYPVGIEGSRAGLSTYTTVSPNYPFPNVGIHYVYAQAGETITLASSAQQSAGTQRIRLYDPSGIEVALTISGSAGHIADRAAELAGPAEPAASAVGSQYTPIYHTATQTGIYRVSFVGYGSGRVGLADADWISGTDSYVSAWDISVFNPDEGGFIPGRVYANVLNLAANASGDVFHGTVYILTKDGYTYRVNANGMMGYLFTFFANNNGFTDIENNLPLYKSLNTTTMSVITDDGHQIHDPNTADTETSITHKTFYTLPAGDLPASAPGAVPGGNTWLINTVVSPNVQDVQITGIDGTVGQVSNKGGYISFDTDAQGQYTVEIESQEIPAAFAKKTLYGIARIGGNEVFWDGKDGDGVMLPEGDIPVLVTVKMQGAEVHFPYFDVEENRNGIVIELLDPDNLSNAVSDMVYWDDSDITPLFPTSIPPTPVNNSHLPPANSSGVSSNSNGHIFSVSFGDNKSLDTWTFIVGEEETVSTVVRVNQSDLEVVSISSNSSGMGSVGDEYTYTSVIHNHGPSAVETNTDPLNGAITRGAIFRLYVPEGIAISTDPSDMTFGSGCAVLVGTPTFSSGVFEVLVDMPADCGATISVKASVVGTVSVFDGNIYTWATILRPDDYTDINATNPDLSNPPTDPFYEANGIWTDYASVALEDPATIDLSQTNNIKLNAIPELPPFDCNGSAYLISAPSGGLNPSTIYVIEPNSPSTVVATITPLIAEKYNGIGYNIEDNYIYGFSEGSTGAIARGNVVRFGANGAVRDLGQPQPDPSGSTTGLATWTTDPVVNPNGGNVYIPTGVVGVNNIFYTPVRTNNTTESYLAKVDLTSMTYTTVPLSLNVFGMDDLAFSPYDGYLYGIFQGQVYRTNPASGVQEIVTLASGSATAPTAAGGAWNDAQGRVYFYVNLGSPTVGSGRLFQYDPSNQLLNDLSAVTTYPTFDATACFPTRLEKRVIMPVDGVGPGDIIDFEFSIYNNQSLPITVDFEDELTSSNLSWVEGSVVFAGSGSGTVSISGNLLQITGITVDPLVSNGGIPLTFTVSVQIANTAEGGDCFDNQASISFGGTSVNSDNPETAELVDPTSFCLNPAAPSFILEKSLTSINGDAATTEYNAVGDELSYTITVTNTGNVTLSNIEVNDALTGLTETIATLAPDGVQTFTTTYTILQSDLDNGSVLNTATATGEDPDGGPVDPEDPTDGEEETQGTQTPALTVTKVITSAGPYNAVGQEITYDIVVSNTGNVTIDNIVLTDANADIPAGEDNIGTLAPGASTTITVTHVITQADLDNGSVSNQALVNGDGPDGTPITEVPSDDPGTPDPNDPTDTDVDQTPSFTLVKALTGINGDAATTSYSAVGDELEYTITVTNTGNVTISNVNVTDPLTGFNQTIVSLAPGAVETYTTTYTVTQSDLDNGSVLNTATATGEDPGGDPVGPEDPDDGEVTTPGTQTPELTVTKVITSSGLYNAVGQEITYDIVVSNTGNVTIDNIVLTDANADIPPGEENIGTLAPGASTTVTVTHVITQEDLNNGSVSNQALVNGDGPNGTPIAEVPSDDPGTPDPNDPTDTDVEQTPALTVTKVITSAGPYNAVGQEITYDIVVANTGNVTIDNIVLTDANADIPSGEENIGTLVPGASATVTVTHVITQADLDNGIVSNQALVNGDGPDGTPITEVPSDDPGTPDPNDPTDTDVEQIPSFTLVKALTAINGDAAATSYSAVGDELEYTITVTNTGNVTLENIAANDPLTGFNQTIVSLAPGAIETFTTLYTIDQDDLDAGSILNTATATGEDPDGNDVDPEDPTDGEVTTPGTQTPVLMVTKVITSSGPYNAVGQEITYDIVVSNMGNVTIDNIVLTDDNADIPAGEENIGTLAPTESRTITVTHVTTPDDLDAGIVSNQALVNGNGPDGTPITEVPSDDPGTPDPDDPTDTDVEQTPSFTLVKALTAINGDAATTSYSTIGDALEYTITVTNTGNVTLVNVNVTDPLTGLTETIASLEPNGVETFTTTYTVTQADLDAGSVLNTAMATGDDPDGGPVDPEDPTDGEVTTPGTQTPSFTLVKELTSINGNAATTEYNAVGDELSYTITVTNTGNVTLSNIEVNDALTGLTETIATLTPDGVQTFTTTYTILQSDLDNGSVLNTATATGEDPDGDPVDPEDPEDGEVTTPGTQAPALTVTKVITSAGPYNAVGQEITYDIVVSNTGNVTIDNIVLADDNADIPSGDANIGTLAPGASATVTVVHTITQADLDAGSVSNQALVNGAGPDGTPITEIPSDDPGTPDPGDPTDTGVEQTPELTVTKVITSSGPYNAVGQEITYDIVVSNTGNVTIDNILLTDDNADIAADEENIGTLAPGASVTVTVVHTITQADLDNGIVSNQAMVNGDGPDGTPITEVPSDDPGTPDPGDPTDSDVEQTPSFTLVKALTVINGDAATTSYSAVGDELEYTITVTNTGNVTLSNVNVTDPLTGFNQTIASLGPNGVATFTTTYTVAQADLDNGSVLNVATATGEDPGDNPVGPENPDDGEVTTPGTQAPALTVTKVITSSGPYNAVGQEITYDIVVSNTGNVTIDNIVLTDANADIPSGEENIGTLVPGASATVTVTHVITQADLDNGIVSNQAMVNGDSPDGTPITEVPSDDPGTPDPGDPTDTDVEQTPALTVTKVITGAGPYNAVGQEITYDIVVSNTGNVTIDNIVLTDANAVIPAGEENIGTLAPGASATVTVVHTITQADLDNSSVSNQATVNGDGPGGTPIAEIPSDDPDTPDPGDPTDTDVEQIPSFKLVKALTAINGDAATTSYSAVGDELEYTITVTNTGNVTLSNVNVTDPLTGFDQTIANLAPNAVEAFTTTYTIDQDDLNSGSVLNTATATGEDPDGGPVDPEDPTDGEEETPGTQTPELAVTKVITSAGPYNAVGDEITYDIVVSNTGNVTIDNIVLTDDNAVIPVGEENIGTLAPGASATVTVTHVITQADLDNGIVSNQALVNGDGPDGTPITEVPSDDPGTPDPNDPTDTD
ncbi:DUF7507 domain-containing protein, partial [Parapedobacter pyrenivorans]